MSVPKLHISKGSFKLDKINNISTNTLTNNYCIKQNKKNNIICTKCYSFKGLNFRKAMKPLLENNSNLLSKNIIDINFLPTIYNIYFRFNSHGELINEIHLINLINIVNKNKHCNFALWSKRNDIIKKYFDKNIKPKNLILIYSNPKLNKPLLKLPKYFDKTFNNITKDKINDFNINCFEKCIDCLKCYTHNNIKTIIEKVK
tara:strand:- start:2655 stop:3260 length:606 start_codon:yes stop_codon:yes gene_type:complete